MRPAPASATATAMINDSFCRLFIAEAMAGQVQYEAANTVN
jgi:hypothetical protein